MSHIGEYRAARAAMRHINAELDDPNLTPEQREKLLAAYDDAADDAALDWSCAKLDGWDDREPEYYEEED